MGGAISVVWIVLSIAVWGVVHSWLASLEVKAGVRAAWGPAVGRAYRLFYNVFAVISFAPILWLTAALPDRPLYSVPVPWSLLMLAGQGAALLLLFVGVLQTGLLEFIGLGSLVGSETPPVLVTHGLYRLVRHPLYTAGLLLLWLTPIMTVNLLVLYAASSAYLVLGAVFEERKLVRQFGSGYEEYRRRTPMFLPRLRPRS